MMESNTLPSSLCHGRYRTSHLLGTGTYGQVICCVDTYSNTSVAVKVSRTDNAYRCAALNEIAALNALHDNHDSVRMLDWFDENEHICIVTELLHQNLYEALREREFAPLTVKEIQAVALRVCSALHCLHIAGYMHCDIKPENIMLKNEVPETYNGIHNLSTINNDVNVTEHSYVLIESNKSASTMNSYNYSNLADHHVSMYHNNINADNEGEEYENRVNKAIYHNIQRAQEMQEYRDGGYIYSDNKNNYKNNYSNNSHDNNIINNNLLDSNNCCSNKFIINKMQSGDYVNSNQLQGGKYNHACVIDFGAVRQFHENAYFDVQSLWYRAPEVLCGIPYTPSIDAWSVGCVLFELFTGKAIFPGHNAEDQLQRIIQLVGYPSTNALNNGSCVGQMRIPFLTAFTHHDITQNLKQYIIISRQNALHRHRHRHRDCQQNIINEQQSKFDYQLNANLASQYQIEEQLSDVNNNNYLIINMNNNDSNNNCTPNEVNTNLTANFDMQNTNMLNNNCMIDIAQWQQFMIIQQQQQQIQQQKQRMQQQQEELKLQREQEQLEEWLVDLIIQMLDPDETRRLSCTDVLQHPFLQQVYVAQQQIEQQRSLSAQQVQNNNTPITELANANFSNLPMVYAQQQQPLASSFQDSSNGLMQTSNMANCDSMEVLMNNAVPCQSLEHIRSYTPSYISLTESSSSSFASTLSSSLLMSSHEKMESNADHAIVSYLPKNNIYLDNSNNIQSTDSIAFHNSEPHITEVGHFTEMSTMPITSSNVNINTTNIVNNNNASKCNIYNPNNSTHQGNNNNEKLQHVKLQEAQHDLYAHTSHQQQQQQQQQQQHVLSVIPNNNQVEQNVNVQNNLFTLLPTNTMMVTQASMGQQITRAPPLLEPYWATNALNQPNRCNQLQHNVCDNNNSNLNNNFVCTQPIPICYDRHCHCATSNHNNVHNNRPCGYDNLNANVCNSNGYGGGRR